MHTCSDPDLTDAHSLVQQGLTQDHLITIIGQCEVEYDGRTSSYLGFGDRLVILKPDGTLLVHTNTQRTPVNWQPPGCTHTATITDEMLLVRSVRSSPSEDVRIRFPSVLQVTSVELTDERDLDLQGTEEDLRQQILDDPTLIEPGFRPLATERPTPAGAIDIYGEDKGGTPVVIELKRRRVGPDAVGQLQRYVDALSQRERDDDTRHVRGILVAPSITDRAARLLEQHEFDHIAIEAQTAVPGTTATLTDFQS